MEGKIAFHDAIRKSQERVDRAIFERAAEIAKKAQGINPRELANSEKAKVIDALREAFPLKELLKKLDIFESSSSINGELKLCLINTMICVQR